MVEGKELKGAGLSVLRTPKVVHKQHATDTFGDQELNTL